MYYLIAVTGVEPVGFDIEYGMYNRSEDFYSDKEKWLNWYEHNKCSITNSKADSLFHVYLDKYQGGRGRY